ncbi:LAFE_0E02014g1_1 [Lachancea fermentati]|uniref:LAFE_0E02014g1_1 n=1 Tax=Lachancea fermentati TaxID=4955 RepID=A0A1G4MCD9_LACFM|nr:LAFE_0E02014g1_1 [Lachancea fermentati]
MLHPKSYEIYFTLNNGSKMPALGLGTANPPERLAETKQAVKAAVKAGYRHIDTAWAYGTEQYIGEALKELFEEGVVKREDLFITTKVWPTHWDKVNDSLESSLKNLGVDYVDLLLQHWPLCFAKVKDPNGIEGLARNPKNEDGTAKYEPDGDFYETYRQLEKLYLDKDPRVKAIGVSNYPIPYLEKLLKTFKVVPAINQVELHPYLPQLELREYCKKHGIVLEAFSPFGADGVPNVEIPEVKEFAKVHDVSASDVLLSYHIRQGVVVVPRSLNPTRIAGNIEFVPLTEEELDRLNKFGIGRERRYRDEQFSSCIPTFYENK